MWTTTRLRGGVPVRRPSMKHPSTALAGQYEEGKHPRDSHGHYIQTDDQEKAAREYKSVDHMTSDELRQELVDVHGFSEGDGYLEQLQTPNDLRDAVTAERQVAGIPAMGNVGEADAEAQAALEEKLHAEAEALPPTDSMSFTALVKEVQGYGYKGPIPDFKEDLARVVAFQRAKNDPNVPTPTPAADSQGLNLSDTAVREVDPAIRAAADKVAGDMMRRIQNLDGGDEYGIGYAVERYTAQGSDVINPKMREGDVNPSDQFDINQIKQAAVEQEKYYEETGRKPPPTLWRAIQGPAEQDAGTFDEWTAREYPTGATVQFKSFTSTTDEPGGFATLTPGVVTYEIHTMQSSPRNVLSVDGMSANMGEREHILMPEASFKVVGVKDVPTGNAVKGDGTPIDRAINSEGSAKVIQLVQIG